MKAQTFSILFWIEKSRLKNGKANLSARITVDGKRVEISTHRKVALLEWDPDVQMVLSKTAEAKEINNHLTTMKANLLSCQSKLEMRGELVTAEAIKNEYMGDRFTKQSSKHLQNTINCSKKECMQKRLLLTKRHGNALTLQNKK